MSSHTQPHCRVTLINLGGPQNASEIEPFLRDLLTDPLMVDMPLPYFLQKRLMSFVARKRAKRVAHKYDSLGYKGGSPLVPETNRQADALLCELKKRSPEVSWRVDLAMSCGFPNLRERSAQELTPSCSNILLPLYPHFSRSTLMSTVRIIAQKTGSCPLPELGMIKPFYQNQDYLRAVSQLICDFLQGRISPQKRDKYFIKSNPPPPKQDWRNLTLIFSAHGIPLRLVNKGDVYPKEIEENAKKIHELLQENGFTGEMHLSYQSRLGPGKWTRPSTIEKLRELGQKGHKKIAIYPISFVSDHLETLEELEVELREVARQNGIEDYHRIPAPGTWPPFISFLATHVLETFRAPSPENQECLCRKWGGSSLGRYSCPSKAP